MSFDNGPRALAAADVLIVGAGPAGLALAAALADAGLRVQVLEQQALADLQAPADDGREIALTHRARAIMAQLGLWTALPADAVAPLTEARVLDGDDPAGGSELLGPRARAAADLRFTNGRSAEPLGWLVPNHHIRAAAWSGASARPGIRIETGAHVAALALGSGQASVALADGRQFSASLVVAADSRFSTLRRMAGIGAAMRDFGRSVVVGPLAHTLPHGGVAWECFGYRNTLALLPMAGQQVSAVVTVPSNQAPEWLALSDGDFAARVQAQTGARLGELSAAGPRHHYPLVGVYAHRFVAARFALIGDAAVGMHPVTAHGWNFGLYGVEVLARAVAAAWRNHGDPGEAGALAAYEREHRRTTLPVYLGTNAVVSLFTDARPLPRLARRTVLAAADRLPGVSTLVKGAITRQLTGRAVRP